MAPNPRFPPRRVVVALAACGLFPTALLWPSSTDAGRPAATAFDSLLSEPGSACGPGRQGQPALLKALVLARSETAPFQPAPMQAAAGEVPLYEGLGTFGLKIATRNPRAPPIATAMCSAPTIATHS